MTMTSMIDPFDLCGCVPGTILFFRDREGFKKSRKENIGLHVQLPDYVVVEESFLDRDNCAYITLVGIKRKLPMINEFESKFFEIVGHIDDQGYDESEVVDDPDQFSTWYATGSHEDEGFLNDLMKNMGNYDPGKEENKHIVDRLLDERRATGQLLPTEIAYVINHLLCALYNAARVGHSGKTKPAYNMLRNTLLEIGESQGRQGKPINVELIDEIDDEENNGGCGW